MPSIRFAGLTAQLAALRTHLLPAEFEPTGLYDDEDRTATLTLAYRVLAHAEVESYFEDRALEVADHARAEWDKGKVTRISTCLFAFSGKVMTLPPESLEAPTANKQGEWPALIDVDRKFVPVASEYQRYVRKENHGIREKNLLALLLPVGLHHAKIDPIFLAEIDSFGQLRGQAAHTSPKTSISLGVDPAEELKRVESVVKGIAAIDAEIDALIA